MPEAYSRWRAEAGAIRVGGRKEDPRPPEPLFHGNRRIVIENNTIEGCPHARICVRCATAVAVRDDAPSHANYVDAPDAGSASGLSNVAP